MLDTHNAVEWPVWLVALTFGLASAASFPIGAAWGACTTSVAADHKLGIVEESRWSAGTLAFGAGCLLFAVTVEIYGTAVAKMERDGYVGGIPSISTVIVTAMFGAWAYVVANRWIVSVASEGFETSSAAGADEETHLVPPGMATSLTYEGVQEQASRRTMSDSAMAARRKSFLVGYASWFGVLVSGIPEGILLGQLVTVGQSSYVLVISLFISNYPTALASASMMKQGGKGTMEIIGMWVLVFLLTGLCAALPPICVPAAAEHAPLYMKAVGDVLEGLAGGSMMASILSLMLPEAYIILGDLAGLLATAGFLVAVALKVFSGLLNEYTIRAYTVPRAA
mmetsp:Transcript_120415/g.312594  ORF Transcript_120415/g.312594 Transcript_120415/m.312594 type:complete len:339 (+) Transcript_120415:134-1150(+)